MKYKLQNMVVSGSIELGFKFFGPFENCDKAQEWIDEDVKLRNILLINPRITTIYVPQY